MRPVPCQAGQDERWPPFRDIIPDGLSVLSIQIVTLARLAVVIVDSRV
jgi:hypothetical protein